MRSAHSKIAQYTSSDSKTSQATTDDRESVSLLGVPSDFEMIHSNSMYASVNSDPDSGFQFINNGGQLVDNSKPLKFTDAVRIHESLSAHNVDS